TRSIVITVLADSDQDGLSDEFENRFKSQDPENAYDTALDVDGDGLTSFEEDFFGADPENPDSDGDGLGDGLEVAEGRSPASRPPQIGVIPDQVTSEGESLTVTVTATDPDGDAVFFSVPDLPPGASFDPHSRTFQYTPGYDVST